MNSIGAEDIKVSWSIDNSDMLGYDGEIGNNVPKKGVLVQLTATMELDKVTEDYKFGVKVFPKKNLLLVQWLMLSSLVVRVSRQLLKKQKLLKKQLNNYIP